MFDGFEVIANPKIGYTKKREKKEEKKGKNNFQNRCIAIVLLRL